VKRRGDSAADQRGSDIVEKLDSTKTITSSTKPLRQSRQVVRHAQGHGWPRNTGQQRKSHQQSEQLTSTTHLRAGARPAGDAGCAVKPGECQLAEHGTEARE
jgi:hypothetical protein